MIMRTWIEYRIRSIIGVALFFLAAPNAHKQYCLMINKIKVVLGHLIWFSHTPRMKNLGTPRQIIRLTGCLLY